jgi:hypothetical protein
MERSRNPEVISNQEYIHILTNVPHNMFDFFKVFLKYK